MTGDTVQLGRNAWNVAKNATVMYVLQLLQCTVLHLSQFCRTRITTVSPNKNLKNSAHYICREKSGTV